MSSRATSSHVEAAFRAACLAELDALKPGNVHRWANGHDLTVAIFEQAATAAAPAIAAPGLTVGQRILAATRASWAAVGTNANLGIVLLAAPLIEAALSGRPIRLVLDQLTVADAECAYEAIRLANPGGLGASDRHDVHAAPTVTLKAAMAAAANRDLIAQQYVTGYADVLAAAGDDAEAIFLHFLTAFPDTHIARKYGLAKAEAVRLRAQNVVAGLTPANRRDRLMAFDLELKASRINPGTSADLTVASLLVHRLGDILIVSQ